MSERIEGVKLPEASDGSYVMITPKGIALVELGIAMGKIGEQWAAIKHAAIGGCARRDGVEVEVPMPNLDDFVACAEELSRATAAFRMYYEAPKGPRP